jgi:hypothetical protein
MKKNYLIVGAWSMSVILYFIVGMSNIENIVGFNMYLVFLNILGLSCFVLSLKFSKSNYKTVMVVLSGGFFLYILLSSIVALTILD